MSHSPDDDPSTQLHATLHTSITRAFSTRRPLLTHLNADTTWLLSLPIPPTHPSPRGRIYYHILIDPWLRGGQSDVARFFSQQWHADPSAVQSCAEIEEVVRGIEDVAREAETFPTEDNELEVGDVIVVDTDLSHRNDMDDGVEGDGEKVQEERWIDAVVISHEFTDHMHKPTLLELSPRVPVLATPKAYATIKSWGHFDTVVEVGRFSGDWRERNEEGEVLPDWVGVSRVAYQGNDLKQNLLYYHSAVMIAFSSLSTSPSSTTEEAEAEAIIYTPHGISPSDIEPVSKANPKIKTLALLHGLQDISLGAQLNMGAHNGLKVQRLLGAKYWIGTHDEVKRGGGLVSWFLDRKVVSLKEAVEREREEHGGGLEGSKLEGLSEVRFEELGNGESLILE
jgi:hypothetical protein